MKIFILWPYYVNVLLFKYTVIAKNSLKKELYIQEFLKRFNVSNKKQTQLKQMIIEAIYEEINNQYIHPQFKRMDPLEKLTNFKLKRLY